ncbi:hypothetical protein [Streptomyces sp. NBC_01618]|uniref:hypothetical protein n=1 Tax=Streptomyces sp. NBC_01618 TaxID=2975900 RepID=UPI0038637A95|nr:hypothetical protein OH735_04880 [Streptomyces sp. NBC_01618]
MLTLHALQLGDVLMLLAVLDAPGLRGRGVRRGRCVQPQTGSEQVVHRDQPPALRILDCAGQVGTIHLFPTR